MKRVQHVMMLKASFNFDSQNYFALFIILYKLPASVLGHQCGVTQSWLEHRTRMHSYRMTKEAAPVLSTN